MGEEIEKFKTYLLDQYKELGGKKNISDFPLNAMQNEIENQKKFNALEKELSDARRNFKLVNDQVPDRPKIGLAAVNQAKNNQALASEIAGTLRNYMDYVDPQFDPRSIEDERYKRDNQLVKAEGNNEENSVVILRDEFGRCDV